MLEKPKTLIVFSLDSLQSFISELKNVTVLRDLAFLITAF